MVIIKYYLVDSENVNDNWLMLLELAKPEDEIIVFYTKNSPHMSYASVIKLLEQNHPIRFEECHAGNNGLDFQLVSYLGYLMKDELNPEAEFIIMSNDAGFDCVVSFWRDRHFPVKRFNVNCCKNLLNQLTAQKEQEGNADLDSQEANIPVSNEAELTESGTIDQSTINQVPAQTVPVEKKPAIQQPAKKSSTSKSKYDFDKAEVDTFINCLGKGNLTAIHETLVHVYGQKQGQKIYKIIKDKAYPLDEKIYKRKDKVKHFSDIIFEKGEISNPGDFVEFLESNKDKTKNLNSIRASIMKKYGNEYGMKYYSLFKPYFKIVSSLKD